MEGGGGGVEGRKWEIKERRGTKWRGRKQEEGEKEEKRREREKKEGWSKALPAKKRVVLRGRKKSGDASSWTHKHKPTSHDHKCLEYHT